MTNLMTLEIQQQTEALTNNGLKFLVPGTTIPISTSPLDAGTFASMSMEQLNQMVITEQNILTVISRAGQAILRDRLMIIFSEMARRFEGGETFGGFTGNKAMGAYLRSAGFDPGKLRVWKFLIRREELAAISGGDAPSPTSAMTKAIMDQPSETAEHGFHECDSESTPSKPAVAEATLTSERKPAVQATPANTFDFEAASSLTGATYLSAFEGTDMQNMLCRLGDPVSVLANADGLRELAATLRRISDHASRLEEKISRALVTSW